MRKENLSFGQICNLSVGMVGIQVGWGLQNANMSAIFEKLGAEPYLLPMLWLAGPVTSILVRPFVGWLSDHTWTRLGRRRPYLLAGSVSASLALLFLPTSPSLWVAVSLLWLLTSSTHTTSEPFRPLVADQLDERQRTTGFVTQAFFIGLGATCANAMPYLIGLTGVTGETPAGIPLTVKYSFQIGAGVFFLSVLWTVLTARETPPRDMEELNRRRAARRAWPVEFFSLVRHMPATMRRLAPVQIFTWLGFFCTWIFFVPTVARHIFKAPGPQSPLYNEGIEWGGVCMASYAVTSFVVSLLLARRASAKNRKMFHVLGLMSGGLGLLSVYLIQNPYLLLLTMTGVGMAWASSHSLPYAIVAGSVPPERMGVYMGIFSLFTAGPGIIASLTLRPLVRHVFDNNPLYLVMLGGASMLVAALLLTRVRDASVEAAPAAGTDGRRRAPEPVASLSGAALADEHAG